MSQKSDRFTPDWYEGVTPANSYRSLFKWGDLNSFKHPNYRLFELLKNTFHLTDADFTERRDMGLEPLEQEIPSQLNSQALEHFASIVGPEDLQTGVYHRVRVSYGGGMVDAMRLRKKIVENIPDVVLAPSSRAEIEAIMAYCNEQRLPLYVYGGGSSVTRGTEAVKGGVTLDMGRHMTRLIELNEINQTVTVEAGMSGPELERLLNQAPELLNAQKRYTCGHFPQSFEYSSVGGWVVTRGAGQNSTFYGKIEDMVLAQEYVTPRGVVETQPYPRSATGPDLDQLMMGSEGCFGVLSRVTLRVHPYRPEATRRFSFIFKDWQAAQTACREAMQGEFGFPSVFRLSDPEETEFGLRLYGVTGTPAETVLDVLGFRPMQRCLFIGSADGDPDAARLIERKIRKIFRRHGGFELSLAQVTKRWEKGRFRDPYLREDLADYGILLDTLECAVTWQQMPEVHRQVRQFIKSRPDTICMTHLSHAYPQGGNLYFIFVAKMDSMDEYLKLQYGVLEAIQKSGAAVSHHHGIGKQTAPWFEEQMGQPWMEVLKALKRHFDPNGILNPGGTLGLDMDEAQHNKRWTLSE